MKPSPPIGLLITLFLMIAACCPPAAALSATGTELILKGLEERYTDSGFTADFEQESRIAAIDVTDRASGKVYVRYPGKMRWEYRIPYAQLIVTNGTRLWIYRIEDKQVLVGKTSDYLGDGKGASFLSDMSILRKSFNITLLPSSDSNFHILALIPVKEIAGLKKAYITVEKKTYNIVEIRTENRYGDETRIRFKNLQFKDIASSLFEFKIPPGIERVKIKDPFYQ